MQVLQGLAFQHGGALKSHFAPMPLSEFLATLPALPAKKPRKATAASAPGAAAIREAAADHPWVAELAAQKDSPQTPPELPQAEAEGSGDESSDLPASDEFLAQVWEALAEKRQQWAVNPTELGEDFTTVVRGGAWTAVHKGRPFEGMAGQAKSGAPSQWCTAHRLNRMATFSFPLYGEAVAATLSLEWCRRMQYYYGLWLDNGGDYAYTLEDMGAYRPTAEWQTF